MAHKLIQFLRRGELMKDEKEIKVNITKKDSVIDKVRFHGVNEERLTIEFMNEAYNAASAKYDGYELENVLRTTLELVINKRSKEISA